MDVSSTAHALTQSTQAVAALANAVPGQALNLATMSVNQLIATLGALGISGVALEQALEKFGIDKCPTVLKPYIPAVVAIGGTMGLSMSQGMPWAQALGLGVGTWVVSQVKHDHAPAITPDNVVGNVQKSEAGQ